MLANLLAWWGWINPYIHCAFPVLMFAFGGKCVKGLVLLYWVLTACIAACGGEPVSVCCLGFC